LVLVLVGCCFVISFFSVCLFFLFVLFVLQWCCPICRRNPQRGAFLFQEQWSAPSKVLLSDQTADVPLQASLVSNAHAGRFLHRTPVCRARASSCCSALSGIVGAGLSCWVCCAWFCVSNKRAASSRAVATPCSECIGTLTAARPVLHFSTPRRKLLTTYSSAVTGVVWISVAAKRWSQHSWRLWMPGDSPLASASP